MNNKLYRSRINRVFGGVASGFAEYLNLDPVVVRVIFIIISIFNGIGVLLYIIFWIIIPEKPIELSFSTSSNKTGNGTNEKQTSEKKTEDTNFGIDDDLYSYKSKNRGTVVFGTILILLGLIFLAENLFPLFDLIDLLPIGLVVIGAVLIYNSLKKGN